MQPLGESDDVLARMPAAARNGARGRTPAPRVAPVLDDAGPMAKVFELVDRVADCDLTVLLQGETGVGKDVVAREIHARSRRARGPFVKVHCAALPSALLESELFGYESGSFTGAFRRKPGKFELAHGGTLLLDEIAEMDPSLQAKLLQVLQDGAFSRIGGNEEVHVDVRVICASNRPIARLAEEGRFRADLYYRIQAVTLEIPPLRERSAEIPTLFRHFLEVHGQLLDRAVPRPSLRLLSLLRRHHFPGNVRELENLARRLAVLGSEDSVIVELLRAVPQDACGRQETLSELIHEFEQTAGEVPLLEVRRRMLRAAEREVIRQTLVATRCNRKSAARILGVSYSTLLEKIRACGLEGLAGAATAEPSSAAAE